MGVTDTFGYLNTLPPEQKIPFLETALREPYREIQAAAFELLCDPGGLNRPDLVVAHYADLTPEIKLRVIGRAAVFREAAKEEIRSPREWSRRAGYEVLLAVSPKDSGPILVRGLSDPSAGVRSAVADMLEVMAQRYYYHMITARMHGDPESRRFVDENRPLMLEALGPILRTYSTHGRRVFMDIALESGEDTLGLVSEILNSRSDRPTYAAVVHAMSTSVSEPAVDLIFRLLCDGRPRVQEAAVEALRLRSDPGFPALVATVLAKMPPERFAVLALAAREIPWWHTVETAPEVDAYSAGKLMEFLARSGLEPAKRDALILFFRGSPNPEIRARMLAVLQTLEYPGLMPLIESLLQDPADEVKLAAAQAVIGLNPPHKTRLLMPLLSAKSDDLRRLVMREVARSSFDKYLRSFDRLDPETREMAAKAIAKIDSRIVERLSDEIASLDADRRLRALRVIDYVDAETDLRDNLMALIADPDRRVRATAVKIVKLSGTNEGLRHLVAALGDVDRRVRANAIEALEDFGDARNAAVILPLLKDGDNRVRANAGKALWTLGRAEGRAALGEMLHDPDESMRLSAAWAIAQAQYPGADVELHARAEVETNPAVQAKIAEGLARLQAPPEGLL